MDISELFGNVWITCSKSKLTTKRIACDQQICNVQIVAMLDDDFLRDECKYVIA
jgi:hypothetical protein